MQSKISNISSIDLEQFQNFSLFCCDGKMLSRIRLAILIEMRLTVHIRECVRPTFDRSTIFRKINRWHFYWIQDMESAPRHHPIEPNMRASLFYRTNRMHFQVGINSLFAPPARFALGRSFSGASCVTVSNAGRQLPFPMLCFHSGSASIVIQSKVCISILSFIKNKHFPSGSRGPCMHIRNR